MHKDYCVYITVVNDVTLKLPTFYIGSSSVDRVNNGYHGTPQSKKYKKLWKEELKRNPHNFSTHILSHHETRQEALAAELALQQEHNVVKSPAFINRSEARPNGFFGMDVRGENGPFYNRTHSKESIQKMRDKHTGKILSTEHKYKIKESLSGTREGENNPFYNLTHSEETKLILSIKSTGLMKGTNWYYHPITLLRGRYTAGEQPEGYVKGKNPKREDL